MIGEMCSLFIHTNTGNIVEQTYSRLVIIHNLLTEYECVCVYVCACVCNSVYVHVHVCVCVCVCVCARVHV